MIEINEPDLNKVGSLKVYEVTRLNGSKKQVIASNYETNREGLHFRVMNGFVTWAANQVYPTYQIVATFTTYQEVEELGKQSELQDAFLKQSKIKQAEATLIELKKELCQ